MDSPNNTDSESTTTPFLLKLFYRNGTFHRPDEFAFPTSLPTHIQVHTYLTCTLLELSHHLVPALPTPAIGTRLSFRLIYPDTSYTSRLPPDQSPPPRYLSKDLGSLVLGEGGPGVEPDSPTVADDTTADLNGDVEMSSAHNGPEPSAAAKTLADAKFVVGDYVSVAVLPPDGSTGAVAPASGARGAELGSAGRRGSGGGVLPLLGTRDNGFVAGSARHGRGGRGGRFGRGDRERDRDGYRFPEGEWRRGERLPEVMHRGGRRGPRW